ncbi:MAG: polysaccharide deacetylase family protein [Chitinophagaceae bacterium]|nr:polysaccharide deacetylase family protein [Chitinophagaceae bacterium]
MLIKNFLFHRVSDEKDILWPPMNVALFDRLVAYISRRYSVVSLEDRLLEGETARTHSRPLATILFDDGYKDNIEYAVPVLEKYKCPASFYVVTDCIDRDIPTWTYIVDGLFQQTQKKTLDLSLHFLPGSWSNPSFRTLKERLAFGAVLKPWMKTLSNEQRREVMMALQQSLNDVAVPEKKMMNWNDLRQMQSGGFVIGSHSVSHPLLASIESEQEIMSELTGSGKRIEAELGRFPVTISYPVGSYDQRVINCAQQAGYRLGLAVKQRFYNSGMDGLFAIPRVELYNEPFWKNRLRISGMYQWMRRIAKS